MPNFYLLENEISSKYFFFFFLCSELEPFLVLARVDPGDDLLELSLGFALREVVHVVILRRSLDQPLGLHVRHCSDVVLGGQNKLVVENPLRLVIEAGGWVKLDDLVVLDGQIVASPLKMRHL